METTLIIGLIAIIAGGGLLAATMSKKSPIKGNPIIPGIIGFGLIIGGAYYANPDWFTPAAPEAATVVNVDTGGTDLVPAFDIDPSALTTAAAMVGTSDGAIATAAWNSAETVFTIPVTTNIGGTHEAFAANETGMNFSIIPVPPVGSNADDLATCYFETEFDMQHEGEDILKDNGNGIFEANFSIGNDDANGFTRWHHSGSFTSLLTTTTNLQLVYGLDGATNDFAEKFQTVGETVTWTVTFHNADWSWSQVFTVNAICIAAA